MVKHIVFWILKDEAEGKTKAENALIIKERLEALREIISEIEEIEVGIGLEQQGSTYDLVLYSVFSSQEKLNSYQNNPDHLQVVDYIKRVVSSREAVDYIV